MGWHSMHSLFTSTLPLGRQTYHVSDIGIWPLQLHLFSRAGIYPGVGPIDHSDGHVFSNQVNSL